MDRTLIATSIRSAGVSVARRRLREHVRQELRAHLLDAVEQHKTAGLPDDEAVTKAMEEFGRPEDLRPELEATHGHRILAVC